MIWKSDGEEEDEQYLMWVTNDLRIVRVMVGNNIIPEQIR